MAQSRRLDPRAAGIAHPQGLRNFGMGCRISGTGVQGARLKMF